jgi:hypothetical protein
MAPRLILKTLDLIHCTLEAAAFLEAVALALALSLETAVALALALETAVALALAVVDDPV